MKDGKKKLNQYRIFFINKEGKKEVTTRFKAADDKAAFEYLKKYRKIANKANGQYYYGDCGKYGSFDEKTKKTVYFDDMEEMHEHWLKDRTVFHKIWFEITYLFSRFRDFKWWCADLLHLVKTRHNRSEAWDVSNHILSDILYNAPKLLTDRNGISMRFIAKAIAEQHKDEKGFDIDEYLKTHFEFDKKTEDLANALYNAEVARLILYVRLYKYYQDFGIIDPKDKEQVEIDKKYRGTLPYLPGRYEEFDYKKLSALSQKYWNKIWAWMSQYGYELCD